jgi:antitoxin ParD1/3/4
MNISFTQKQEQYIADQISEGDFQNASEVVRDALRLHQYFRQHVIRDLRTEIERGWDGEASERTVSDILNAKTGNR